MDARLRDRVVSFAPEQIRHVAKTEVQIARSRLESKRKEKILHSLNKATPCDEPSSITTDLRHNAMLAAKSISNVPPCSETMERVDRAPNGLAWVRVSTNLKAPDNYKDKFFVPYLGESDEQQNFSNSVAADADQSLAEQYTEDDISDIENTVKVTPVEGPDNSPGKPSRSMKRKSQRNGESRVATTRSGTGKGKKPSEIIWDRAAKRVALEQIMKKLRLSDIRPVAGIVGEVFGHSKGEIEACYKNVMYRRQSYKESDDEAELRHSQKEDLITQLKGTVRTQPGAALQGDSVPFFFCRQCYIYNCLEHGTQTAKPARQPPDRTKKDTATRQAAEDIELRCPDKDLCQCWCISQSTEDAHKWWQQVQRNKVLKDNVKSVVVELFASFGKDPCRISELGRLFLVDHSDSGLTCHRVGFLLETFEETNVKLIQPRQAMRRSKKKYRTKAPRGETESMKGGQRVDYAPCQHDGPCTAKNCRCVENGVNCEKYCSCNHNRTYSTRPDKRLPCPHAFQGCTCKSAVACISNACVCYSYGRECDPDLCRACYDCRDSDGRRSCRNVGLLLGERQRTVVGHSDTHGWGAFAAKDIGKGEIIGEYVGEVVSHTDADRRGRLYDEIDYSFLFNITEDWALDSTRLGNKLRYCNHHFKPNCTAKLMRVGGDVRVGLYAEREIGKHEELFFDYKYKNGPSWAMPGSDEKGNSSCRKQDESAKKRAPAVNNNEEDEEEEEEVIPVPKKRARPEQREHSPHRQLRDASRYAMLRDAGERNVVSRGGSDLRAKEHSGEQGVAGHRGGATTDMDWTSMVNSASPSGQKDLRNVIVANNMEGPGVGRSDDNMDLVTKTTEQTLFLSERLSDREGIPNGIKLRKEKSRNHPSDEPKISQSQGQLRNPPDSRANNVMAVDSLDVADDDLRTHRTRIQNGLNRGEQNITRRPNSTEREGVEEPSKLRDVFGSDLDSLDENVNQSSSNPNPLAQVDVTRNSSSERAQKLRDVFGSDLDSLDENVNHSSANLNPFAQVDVTRNSSSEKSKRPRFASRRALGSSSDSSADSREAQLVSPRPTLSTVIRRAEDRSPAPAGITMIRSQRRDKAGKTPEPQSNVRSGEVLSGNTNRGRDTGTAAGFTAKLNAGHSLQIPSGRAPSEIPHINLVSDDEENLNCRSSPATLSNS